ncbi:hypothetical protein J4E91_000679 [Alternaria rosae]|nr:hypothetical protein J4E91_000679 [Alternaria rosae]
MPRIFSTSFGQEESIVLMSLDGTLDMEYHYDKRGFQEFILERFGPWSPVNTITQPVIQHAQPTNTSLVDKEATPTSSPHAPTPSEVPKDAQSALLDAQGASFKTQVAPLDEQQDLLDTEETPTDTLVTPLDIDTFDQAWIRYISLSSNRRLEDKQGQWELFQDLSQSVVAQASEAREDFDLLRFVRFVYY